MTGYVWRGTKPLTALCQCGCGLPAPIAKRTDRRYGAVRGQPRRFVKGHNPKGQGQDMSAARAALAQMRAAEKGDPGA